MHVLRTWFLVLWGLSFGLASCRPDPLPMVWEDLSTGKRETLYRLIADPDGGVWIAGGDTWYHGAVYHLPPGGLQVQTDLRTEKALLGLGRGPDGSLAATGVDGHIHLRSPDGNWENRHPQRWEISRAIRVLPSGRMVIGGGNAFESGYMFYMDPGDPATGQFDHLNRINDLACPEPGALVAAGYGIMYRSRDDGMHWEVLDVSGDHFMQMHFAGARIGYAVGYGGSILKTTDGGGRWERLRNGRRLDTRGLPFRAVHFRDESNGVVAGDRGILWLTTDGGDSWKPLESPPGRSDLHGVLLIGKTLLVCGERGGLYRASLP